MNVNECIVAGGVLFLVGERIGFRMPDMMNAYSRWRVKRRLAKVVDDIEAPMSVATLQSIASGQVFRGELGPHSVESGIYVGTEEETGGPIMVAVYPMVASDQVHNAVVMFDGKVHSGIGNAS